MRLSKLATTLVLLSFMFPASAFAHHARHHRYHIEGNGGFLAPGLIHMLNSMEPHPQGCPWRAFCGCGVADRVFGYPRRDLWPAAAWYRFPRGSFSPGNVIVRPHHVKYIESVSDNGVGMCYDPNSGGHQTRIQRCLASDGTIVSPR